MNTQTYNFKKQRSGDTFTGVRITCTRTSNGVEAPINLIGASITMQVRRDRCLNPVLDLSIESGIVIEDAVNGVIRIQDFITPIVESFNYVYDLQFSFSNGVVQTYLEGNFPIESDITN